MPNLVKMQAKKNNKLPSATTNVSKGLGASLLCLSVLAGCASNPDQEPLSESMNETTQAKEVTAAPESNAKAEQGSTEITPTPDNTGASQTQPATNQEAAPQSAATNTTAANEATQATSNELTENTVADAPTSTETDTAVAPAVLAVDAEAAATEATLETTPALDATAATETTPELEMTPAETTGQPLVRSSKNLGKSYGIWTLKEADNGYCKLKTPTLQIGGKEYSSQIWLDIEEQKIVVNAYMPLNIEHPKTGIQIDNQALTPFTEKVNSTRAVVMGDMTSQLASGKELHIFINGKEVGKQVLKRNVKLTSMNNAISALRSCSK